MKIYYSGKCRICGRRREWRRLVDSGSSPELGKNYTTCLFHRKTRVFADSWIEIDDNGNVVHEFGIDFAVEKLKEINTFINNAYGNADAEHDNML